LRGTTAHPGRSGHSFLVFHNPVCGHLFYINWRCQYIFHSLTKKGEWRKGVQNNWQHTGLYTEDWPIFGLNKIAAQLALPICAKPIEKPDIGQTKQSIMRSLGFILLIISTCLFGQNQNNNITKLPLTFKSGYANAIEPAPFKTMLAASDDTVLGTIPQINAVSLNDHTVKLLSNLGMLWGFLKYYHPAIAKGDYDWDAELLKILPGCFTANSDKDFYAIVNHLVDTLGTIPLLDKHDTIPRNKINVLTDFGNGFFPDKLHYQKVKRLQIIKVLPDFGNLFFPDNLPSEIVKKLQIIRDNYVEPPSNHYIWFTIIGNPSFTNEISYQGDYPTVGVRLISLFRYWNMVQYFFPSRYLIKEDWNKMLPAFIPKFIHAKDKNEYVLACLELIGHIHDTHANIYANPVLESLRGEFIAPFKAEFIEDKLVVTAAYNDSIGMGNDIKIGDIVKQIDNISIDSLKRKWLPLTPASNLDAQLRDLPSMRGFLLRSNVKKMQLAIEHNGRSKKVSIDRIPMKSANIYLDWGNPKETKGYRFINNEIGYVYPAKLKEKDIDSIRRLFINTKGLVIDLRNYPTTAMPFTYGNWLKPRSSEFVRFTKASLVRPGAVLEGSTLENGGQVKGAYKGQVVIIVNAITQSQAEYTTMALSGFGTNTIVLGSTTAGADGDISPIHLPGGISTVISGLGVYYPDWTETQRKGVKISVLVKPTIKGIQHSVDELLDKAIEIINKGRQ
jgi:hypothetical protein